VQAVEDPVDAGGEEDPGARDQHQTAEKGVEGGEEFGGRAGELRTVDGTLPAHQHGRLKKGIDPGKSADKPVTENAQTKGEGNEDEGDEEVVGQPPEENVMGRDWLAMMLEGHPLLVDRLNWQTKKAERSMGKISQKVGTVLPEKIAVSS
jgi:hypothetical protein